MYLASLRAGETRGLFLMTVTDLGLVVKASPDSALVYAVNLDTGAPLPNTDVRMRRSDAQIGQGRTDAYLFVALALAITLVLARR